MSIHHQRGFYGPLLVVLCVVGLIVLFVVTVFKVRQQNREWAEFKVKHSCKIVAKINGSVTTSAGISSSGNVVTTPIVIPSKTGWLCDDGITYFR